MRAVYFDKSPNVNWALDWHQDRVICVKEQREAPEFKAWTNKAGLLHVSPPIDVLQRMITLRVHLDDVGSENAPLLIALGSHRLGRVAEREVREEVGKCGTFACLAKAGDIWLYATPILHASERARAPQRRRVLQLDYADFELPLGLEWREII